VDRIVVIGTSGSGKTTVATRLADRLGLVAIELDGIAHGPGWVSTTPDAFRQYLDELTRAERWVVDGTYLDRTADTLWRRADTIVWLDLPLRVVLPRLVRRSVGRIRERTELWNGNREGWSALFGPESVVSWAVRSQRRMATELPARLDDLARSGVTVVRLRSDAAISAWLTAVAAATAGT
jgi:adenylate kinase family enzyme